MNQLNKILCLLLMCVFLFGCANSQFMLDRGKQSYLQQDYRQAFLRLEPVAKAGNAEAQYAIAYMYFYGRGVVEDREEAIKWMKRAASQGFAKASEALKIIKRAPKSRYQPSKVERKQPL